LFLIIEPEDDAKYAVDSSLINRRGIYKDVLGSGAGREWSDYQFRPNFPIAMAVAPELFDEKHALGALQLADQILRSPLGMKSLDPADLQYRPYYDNSDDSSDAAIAKGLNYHNVSAILYAFVKIETDDVTCRDRNGAGRLAISCEPTCISTPRSELGKRCVHLLNCQRQIGGVEPIEPGPQADTSLSLPHSPDSSPTHP
jgi:Amylo-alpha-1,6-glucosidase